MPPSKRQLSVRIDAALLAEMKNLCRDYSGKSHYLNFATEVENALRARLAILKQMVGETEERTPMKNHFPTRGRQP